MRIYDNKIQILKISISMYDNNVQILVFIICTLLSQMRTLLICEVATICMLLS